MIWLLLASLNLHLQRYLLLFSAPSPVARESRMPRASFARKRT